ncbi:glycosyltransferase family 2 protein [Mariniflexile sp.]|uniref:glycosyltransferase family 2 protein n=1 Tax=Mariniflexile sp. TaxID=1979402 RepID=UPI0040475680
MQNNLFSVLVANYNNGHFFKDCYQSIISQTYANWEVIIVDDASTDNSVLAITKLIQDDKRFKLFQNKVNKGCGFTKRECAAQANGAVLGFLDPDDALKPHALEFMVEKHNKFKKAAIITSKYEFVDLEMNFIKNGNHGSNIPKDKSYLTYGKGAMTHFASFKNEAYQQSVGINSKMKRAVDQDLYYKMEEQGTHEFLDEVLYSYRIHDNSISCNDNLYKAQYWHFYAINKAYKRRKRLKSKIDNFSKEYMGLYQSRYYFARFEKLKFTKKFKAKCYFLGKAFIANPLHDFDIKLKSFLLLIVGRI